MRILGTNDYHDYKNNSKTITRTSARCIVIENGKIYLSYSKKFDYYKLPGGGVDRGEVKKDSAIREAREEAGIQIDKSSMKLYGVFIDKWRSVKSSDVDSVWVNKSYYYICKRYGDILPISPTESEIYAESEAVLVDIKDAIKANKKRIESAEYSSKERFLERENMVFEMILKELM